jgi:hypothetical protein
MGVLGFLKEHEAHGSELKRSMAELPGGRGGIAFGSLSSAPRLELADVRHPRKAATSEPKSGRRDEKRNRKVVRHHRHWRDPPA